MPLSSPGILLLLSVSVGVAMIGLGIIWPLIPVYAIELGAGGFLLGLIIASFNIARVLLNPFSGRISDRFGRKRFIVSGLLLYAVIGFCYVLPTQAETLIAIRFFHGLVSVLVVPIAMALAADIAPKDKLGLYMGTLNMAIMLGLGIGPVLGGGIRDHFGMHTAFYAMGLIALFTGLLVMIFLPSDRLNQSSARRHQIAPFRQMLTHPVIIGIMLMRFFSASGQGAVYTFLPILALQLNLTSSHVGTILGINIFLIAFLQRTCGALADRTNPKYMMIIGGIAAGMTVFGMPFVEGFTLILTLNILMGSANGVSLPGGMVITGQLGRTMGMASLMSLTDAAWNMGMIVSPILAGIILDVFGLPSVFITASILIMVGCAVAALFLWSYEPDRSGD